MDVVGLLELELLLLLEDDELLELELVMTLPNLIAFMRATLPSLSSSFPFALPARPLPPLFRPLPPKPVASPVPSGSSPLSSVPSST